MNTKTRFKFLGHDKGGNVYFYAPEHVLKVPEEVGEYMYEDMEIGLRYRLKVTGGQYNKLWVSRIDFPWFVNTVEVQK